MKHIERMNRLISRLNDASRAYYQEDREIMSNQEYDALYDELAALEAETGIVLSGSPTRKVGYEAVEGLSKVPHDKPLLSLDKTKESAKLVSFLGEQEGLLSWKLDGLAIVLKYDNGKLAQAITRGNGQIGENVTHTAKVFANLPSAVTYTGAFSIRGEAIITNEDFKRINEADPQNQYKNPRNLCSGTVRQLNSEVAAKRGVRFFAFELLSGGLEFNQKSEQLGWLTQLGFTVVEHTQVTAATVEVMVEDYKKRVADQPFASDGLVLMYNDIAYSQSLGATSKFPRDAIAFKWADEIRETTLLHIEWNTSRTGLINPVAVFEPVDIEGTSVNRASLHNVSVLRGLALGEGDCISVYKANMIIPQVAENLTRSNTAVLPSRCPVCGGETEVMAVREGEALYCLNPNCRAQLVSGLAHFCSRDAMNIEGLSEQTLEKFVTNHLVRDYTDLFTLFRHEETILQMEGFGRKSYDNLIASVERAKDAALPNFIYALGIKYVGLANAKLLCAYYKHDTERITNLNPEELHEIKGFGEAISRSLHVYFTDEKNKALVRKALGFLRIAVPAEEPETAPKPLNDLTFVITGDVRRFENRKALQNFIEGHGGRATGSVTAKTSYLINNDVTSVSGKNKKAAELGVPVFSEDGFMERFGLDNE
jgi:DNA ligase (NAD+)